MARRILLTGATGRLGAMFVRTLLGHPDYRVVGLVRDPQRARLKYEALPADQLQRLEFVRCDLTNAQSVNNAQAEILRGMTTGAGVDLILCGGSYNWFGLSNPSNSPYLVDYEGTKLLVNALLGASPSTAPTIAINHVIFISSSGVTPGAWRAAILDIALGNYSKWKAATEEYLLQSMRAAIPNVTIVRPGGLYDDPATKTVFPRPNIHTGDKMGWGPTSRTMVAQLCTDILGKHEAYRKIFELDDAKELDDRTNPQAILPTLGALSQIH